MDAPVMLLVWLGVIIVTLVIEIITQGLTTIWFSIGAAVSSISTIWHTPIWLQILIFAVVSVGIMLLARPFAKRMMANPLTPTNVDRLLHEKAIVIEQIDNLKGTGKVRLRDIEWTARSKDDIVIPVDETVNIDAIEGVKLIVSKENTL